MMCRLLSASAAALVLLPLPAFAQLVRLPNRWSLLDLGSSCSVMQTVDHPAGRTSVSLSAGVAGDVDLTVLDYR